jgi:hypothetical protein
MINDGLVLEGTTDSACEEFCRGHEESEDRTKEGTFEIRALTWRTMHCSLFGAALQTV